MAKQLFDITEPIIEKSQQIQNSGVYGDIIESRKNSNKVNLEESSNYYLVSKSNISFQFHSWKERNKERI